jgi:hypothetical protein
MLCAACCAVLASLAEPLLLRKEGPDQQIKGEAVDRQELVVMGVDGSRRWRVNQGGGGWRWGGQELQVTVSLLLLVVVMMRVGMAGEVMEGGDGLDPCQASMMMFHRILAEALITCWCSHTDVGDAGLGVAAAAAAAAGGRGAGDECREK